MTLVFVRNYFKLKCLEFNIPWITWYFMVYVIGCVSKAQVSHASDSPQWHWLNIYSAKCSPDVRKGRRCFLFDMSCLSPLRWLRVEILSGSPKAPPQILKFFLPRTSVTDLLFFVQVPKCKVLKLESVFGGYLIIFNHGIHHYLGNMIETLSKHRTSRSK